MALWWPVDNVRVTGEWANSPEFYKQFGQVGHNGIDLGMGVGTPVYAADAGVIDFEGWGQNHSWMGNPAGICVLIRHGWGYTGYAHLSSTIIDRGQSVGKGQLIGYSGSTGASTGPHLHFETLPPNPNFRNGYAGRVNPHTYGLVARGTSDNPAPAPAQLAANQRQVGSEPVNRRVEPNTQKPPIPEQLAPGTVGDFNGWIRGETVNGNNIWFRGAHSGNWFWSGAFTSQSTAGLEDLNPKEQPKPPAPSNPAERTVGANPARKRNAPNTSGSVSGEVAAGTKVVFDGWATGEKVSDSVATTDLWYHSAEGWWTWAGAYTAISKDGLKDMTSTSAQPAQPAKPFTYKKPNISDTSPADFPAWIKFEIIKDNELNGETEESWNKSLYEYYNSKYGQDYQYEPVEFHAHWWDDPSKKPQHDGVVEYLKGKEGVTVNFVVSANRITQMMPLTWMATTTGKRNPYGWKAEIDPQLTDDVYKTVAALVYIVESKNTHLKNEPIRLHKEFMATSCSNIDTVKLREWVNKFVNKEYDIATGKPVVKEEVKPEPVKDKEKPVEQVIEKPVKKPTKPKKEEKMPEKYDGPKLTVEEWNKIQADNTAGDASTAEEVAKYNLISKEFWNYSAERIIKTFAMTASGILSTTGVYVIANPETANVFSQVGWQYMLSVAGVSALNSFLVALSNFKDVVDIKNKEK